MLECVSMNTNRFSAAIQCLKRWSTCKLLLKNALLYVNECGVGVFVAHYPADWPQSSLSRDIIYSVGGDPHSSNLPRCHKGYDYHTLHRAQEAHCLSWS